MISANDLIALLREHEVDFYTGVPDSLLKEFCRALSAADDGINHVTACNEGAAMGIAIGHHLATGHIPAIYLQNSGLGNLVNPYCSLADVHVYAIPALLIIGWRGELTDSGEQLHDEPQHVKQGQVTLSLLETLDIPYYVVDGNQADLPAEVASLLERAKQERRAVALVCRKNTFSPTLADVHIPNPAAEKGVMTREEIVACCLEILPPSLPIVSTTGMLSRELYELRERNQISHEKDFLTVGGMGHASQIALGIALANPQRQVVCMDGDGAVLMHLGGLTNTSQVNNILHIVINNGAHASVGGQVTLAANLRLSDIAHAIGYSYTQTVTTALELALSLTHALSRPQNAFIEVLCRTGHRADLGRPKRTPIENKTDFMNFLQT
ncbi:MULTISPECIES: phosphonopyruvate decarboxylase [unclassified Brenneria]|uniref:phosphonopyruvate decarboxylase n=1 Tax=unclassified Brenneria TaxID=2634434 RepID=UPI001557DF3A|nr:MULTISPECIES: phosphonopyruvate decarboxylase [unclassified Brenneria]MBJ7221982.1 phosphonopyruvate decarboxylase [Brenneria sp. L3-3C-1]MEE3643225.1 phosphonopyruvate decarboxylase [Brenneria sp. L3_3C_1]MEE3650586.1 phosphonopyruvate decarboxylase [Brenneria sp. HEZEL_4_2_4]NPD00541.1 phosphonopyruvate decarboxylase [Brenneria sp. hezel4-2-4]